jgi:hypothetical protein
MCRVQVFDGADARQQEHCHPRALHTPDDRVDPLEIAVSAESIGKAGSGQPVAV